MEEQPLNPHQQGGQPVIAWGPIRLRGRGRAYATGPLAELLFDPEIDKVAHARQGELDSLVSGWGPFGVSPFDQLDGLVGARLLPYGVPGVIFDLEYLVDVWEAIGPRVRRALLCIEFLSDRTCPRAPLFRLPLPAGFDANKPRFGLPDSKAGRQAFWSVLERSGSGTTHLYRPGGFAETDIGWMAGAKTRAARRWVRERLERIGAIRRVDSRGQARYLPTTLHARGKLKAATRARGHREIRSIGRLALASAPGRSDPGGPVRWRPLDNEHRTSYVIGPPPPPAALRQLEKSLEEFTRAIGRRHHKRSRNWTRGERAIYKWAVKVADRRTTEFSGVESAVLIPLG